MSTAGGAPKLAFLGLGIMGAPMALRLSQAGLLQTVWNRSAARAEALTARGIPLANDPASATAETDIACLCLTDGRATETVVFGPNGVASHARKAPRLIIDFTTSSPEDARRLAALYAERTGGAWLDAPVSGGPARAEAGELVIFCGGDQASFDAAQPVFAHLAKRTTLAGAQGAGQTVKLCAQLIAAPTIAVIAEALAAAEANGLDAASLPDLLADGLADSPLLQLYGRRMAGTRDGPRAGAIATMLKDIAAAVAMAQSAGATSPVSAAARDLYRTIDAAGGDHELEYLLTFLRSARDQKP